MRSRESWSQPLWKRIFAHTQSIGAPSPSSPGVVAGPLRYALVGAGNAARSHLTEILGKPDMVLVGIADPAPRASWRIPAQWQTVPHFTDIGSLLRETAPHVVSICTPPKYHHKLTLLAFRAGAHVICEKPMAMTIREAVEMEEARMAAGRLGAINFSYRNVPAFRYARHLIANGDLGRLTRVSAAYLQSYMATSGVLWSWRHDASIAGFGVLGDLGVHMIDAVRFVTGLEFQRVVSLARTMVPRRHDNKGVARKITTDTHAMFLAELSGDAIAVLETTQLAPGYGNLLKIEVSGELGSLCIDSEHPEEIRLHASPTPARQAIWETSLPACPLPDQFIQSPPPRSPGAMIEAIRGASVEYPNFLDGVATQKVLRAVGESAASEAWVQVR